MFGKPTPTAIRLMKERGITQCEVVGCHNLALEAHHCLYGKKKKHSELDMDENLCLVCEDCHSASGKAKSFEHKLNFWHIQCERFGHKHMVDWHNSVRLKMKEHSYQ